MRRLEAKDLKEMNLVKHYRIIRQWAAKNNNLTSADIELLIYLDCIDIFSKIDFKMGAYSIAGITEDGIDYYKKTGLKFGVKEIIQLKSIIYIRCLLKVSS